MKLITLAAGLAAAKAVAGHTVFTTLFVNDVDQGDGTFVRMPKDPSTATNFVNDLTSDNMACGFDGTEGVSRVCPVDQSSKLSFLFREWADGTHPGSIDESHMGPCAVYMKAVSSAITDTAAGDGWFKIWEEGYDSASSQWCTEKLIQNDGFLSVNIPSDLAGGYYLVRPELLALHDADKSPPNPQFYVGCAQIFLKSTATEVPENTVSIPGHVDISNPSVLFNVWEPKFPYPLFGPPVYTTASQSKAAANVAQVQTEGLLPAGAILTNANWWAFELEPYSTQDGCWNASKSCWADNKVCYDTAPPTGSKNCKIWEDKCQAINDACNANDFNGPPNAGKDLNPPVPTFDSIPAAENVAGEVPVSASVSATSESTPVATTVESAPTTALETPEPTPTTEASSTITSQSVDEPATATTIDSPTTTSEAETPAESEDTECEADLPQATTVSTDATCGGSTGLTCLGSDFGDCCSHAGWCGGSSEYCGAGCLSDFGSCGGTERRHIPHGRFARSHSKHRHV